MNADSLSSKYAAAIDRLGEAQEEYDFLRRARTALLDGPTAHSAPNEFTRQLKASNRLLDAAWKRALDAKGRRPA